MRLVFVAHDAGDPNGTPLGEMTEAYGKVIRRQYNGDGEGGFTIDRHSAQAAWFEPSAPPVYVKVYLDDTSGDPIFGFLPDNGGDTILSADEQGGEEYTRTGKGTLSYLADAILFNTDFTGNATALPDTDGNWHWANQPAAACLVRQLEEALARGCFPDLTYDFSRSVDSSSAAWSESGPFKLPIGMNLREVVSKCQSAGVIVAMDPDLVLHAWDDHPGADVSGTIVLTPAENLRDAVERQVQSSPAISTALVQGDLESGALKFRVVNDAGVLGAIGRRKEGYIRYNATPTNAILDRVGRNAINATKAQYDGPTSVPVLIRAGEVPFTDYQPGDLIGVALPGVAAPIRIAAISLIEDQETGEVDPVLDLGEEQFDPLEALGSGPSAGGTGPGGTGGDGGGCDDCPDPSPPVHDDDPVPHVDLECEASLAWFEDDSSGGGTFDSADTVATLSVIGGDGFVTAGLVGTPWVLDYPAFAVSVRVHIPDEAQVPGTSFSVSLAGTTGGTYGFAVDLFVSGGVPGDNTIGVRVAAGETEVATRIPIVNDYVITFGWNGAGGTIQMNGVFASGVATGTPTFVGATFSAGGVDYFDPSVAVFTADVASFCTLTTPVPPAPNQFVDEVVGTGDGVTVLYHTSVPYVPGTLTTFANDLPEFNIVETDPATGAYTYESPPFLGEILRARFVATGASPPPPPPVDPSDAAPGALQDLIDAASPGATINVPDGIYRESVVVDKALTVNCPGGSCIIDGRDTTGGVPVRDQWMLVTADDVNVSGFTMRYTTGGYSTQYSAAGVEASIGVERFVLDDCDLSFSWVNVSIIGAIDSTISNCSVHDAKHLGVRAGAFPGPTPGLDQSILGNAIFHNNRVGDTDPDADGGNMKITNAENVTVDGNDVYDSTNGIWLDVECLNGAITNNKVHDHDTVGIFDETSTGSVIHDNAVWRCGFGPFGTFWWGAGILVSSSDASEVYDNVVAWNHTGITVVSQARGDNSGSTNHSIHDNIVVMEQPTAGNDRIGLYWVQDWAGTLFDVGSANAGADNGFWYPAAETINRFAWNGFKNLAAFAATPGGAGSTYISDAAKVAALTAAGIPLSP